MAFEFTSQIQNFDVGVLFFQFTLSYTIPFQSTQIVSNMRLYDMKNFTTDLYMLIKLVLYNAKKTIVTHKISNN